MSTPELPDFSIPHAEKIEWMIETAGYAIEPVAPDAQHDPPTGGYSYTIGLMAETGFPEIAVFGLTPVASRGLIDMVVATLREGTEIPIGFELTGLFDNDLRCVFADVDVDASGEMFFTAAAWYRGKPFRVVQLLWPDRSGWLPYESGFDPTLRLAQPVVGTLRS